MSNVEEVFMVVRKYIPEKKYGFLCDGKNRQAFFHENLFDAGPGDAGPPPVSGEEVLVSVDFEAPSRNGVAKAINVRRIQSPYRLSGRIVSFNKEKGYGFAEVKGGNTYYIHRSEVIGGDVPQIDQEVTFYVSAKKRGARASYIELNKGLSADDI